jgi:hypothetical protein
VVDDVRLKPPLDMPSVLHMSVPPSVSEPADDPRLMSNPTTGLADVMAFDVRAEAVVGVLGTPDTLVAVGGTVRAVEMGLGGTVGSSRLLVAERPVVWALTTGVGACAACPCAICVFTSSVLAEGARAVPGWRRVATLLACGCSLELPSSRAVTLRRLSNVVHALQNEGIT